MNALKLFRRGRVSLRQMFKGEPRVPVTRLLDLEFHGNDYCGWMVPSGLLGNRSAVVDIGLGEDVAFSVSLGKKYGCAIHGFDPTPRALAYMQRMSFANFVVHPLAVAATAGTAHFHLPDNVAHVSGSLVQDAHNAQSSIQVRVVSIRDVFDIVGAGTIDLLKVDIEGSEFELISSEEFAGVAGRIKAFCVEFHHRWSRFGPESTRVAAARLGVLGFDCAWANAETNEEFLFVNRNLF